MNPVRGKPESMNQPLRARVRNGRLVLDEPTDLPEGTEVPLELSDGIAMDEEERKALVASIRRGVADGNAGRVTDAATVIAELKARARKVG